VATAGLADIDAGDPHPPVGGRVGEHALQRLSIAGLDLRTIGERSTGDGDLLGESVAHALQLTQVGDTR
jgi:hypothetical protein